MKESDDLQFDHIASVHKTQIHAIMYLVLFFHDQIQAGTYTYHTIYVIDKTLAADLYLIY